MREINLTLEPRMHPDTPKWKRYSLVEIVLEDWHSTAHSRLIRLQRNWHTAQWLTDEFYGVETLMRSLQSLSCSRNLLPLSNLKNHYGIHNSKPQSASSILTSSLHLHLGLPNTHFRSDLLTTISYTSKLPFPVSRVFYNSHLPKQDYLWLEHAAILWTAPHYTFFSILPPFPFSLIRILYPAFCNERIFDQ